MRRIPKGDHAILKLETPVNDISLLRPAPNRIKILFGGIAVEIPKDEAEIDQQQLEMAISVLEKLRKK